MVLLHGPYSNGKAFTTLNEKRTPVGQLIDLMRFKPAVVKQNQQQTSSVEETVRRPQSLSTHVTQFVTSVTHRVRGSAIVKRMTTTSSTSSSSDIAQRRMAFILLVGFLLVTLLCAWFANQFLLKFSDDSPAARWAGSRASLEDSSSSARAALYAMRGQLNRQQP